QGGGGGRRWRWGGVGGGDLRAGGAVGGLGPPEAAVETLQRVAHRTEQLADRGLARVQVAARALLELAELRAGEVEERPAVQVERLPRQRLEGVAKPCVAGFELRHPLRPHPAL